MYEYCKTRCRTYLDKVESLVDGGVGIEGVAGIDLSGDLARNDLENLLAELNQESVESVVDLLVDVATLLLSVIDGSIDQLGVLGLLGSSEDEGGVGGGILGLVLANGCKDCKRPYERSYHGVLLGTGCRGIRQPRGQISRGSGRCGGIDYCRRGWIR